MYIFHFSFKKNPWYMIKRCWKSSTHNWFFLQLQLDMTHSSLQLSFTIKRNKRKTSDSLLILMLSDVRNIFSWYRILFKWYPRVSVLSQNCVNSHYTLSDNSSHIFRVGTWFQPLVAPLKHVEAAVFHAFKSWRINIKF